MAKNLPNPYLRGLLPIFALATLSLLAALGLKCLSQPLSWIAWAFFTAFGLAGLLGWLLGAIQKRRAAAFLASSRPLVRWVYTPAEWQQVKDAAWQESRGDWKIQWGCLMILLALAGALTGGMIAIPEGILQMAGMALLGFGVGAMIGGLIGGVVAASNHWAARLAYRDPEAGQVALGIHEVYANGDYFRGDGVIGYLREAKISRGRPTTLELQLVFPPRVRREPEETWTILVPTTAIETIEEVIPKIVAAQNGVGR